MMNISNDILFTNTGILLASFVAGCLSYLISAMLVARFTSIRFADKTIAMSFYWTFVLTLVLGLLALTSQSMVGGSAALFFYGVTAAILIRTEM